MKKKKEKEQIEANRETIKKHLFSVPKKRKRKEKESRSCGRVTKRLIIRDNVVYSQSQK